MRRIALFLFCLFLLYLPAAGQEPDKWVPLFDGKSLAGWKASENATTFRVEEGNIVAEGPRSHLFYTGNVRNGDFRNFELKAEVKARAGANSGIYFHTAFQPEGWPAKGFEVQINNTHLGEGTYRERKKTGSLYGVRNLYKALAQDDEWFELHIAVRGKQVRIRVNGVLVVDWVEPNPPVLGNDRGRLVDHGTFALQGHDPHSKVFFRNIAVRPLPDDAVAGVEQPVADEIDTEIIRLGAANYPLVDFHVHLHGATLEDMLAESRRTGIQFGIAVNGGLYHAVKNDATAEAFLREMKGHTGFLAMQGEGREWVKQFSKATLAKFDYLFTDSMTFTDDRGKRMRLWIPAEVGEIADPQAFMEVLVDRTVGVLNNEPIDIYVNPTFLPDVIASSYESLWTAERMKKVVDAAKQNDVAIEINSRYRLPSPTFIRMAKQAGLKFTCGTNNGGPTAGRSEYCIQMIKECKLGWQDFWVPRPEGEKAVQRKK